MARRFGYSRVSTSDQDWSLQLEALTKAGDPRFVEFSLAPLE